MPILGPDGHPVAIPERPGDPEQPKDKFTFLFDEAEFKKVNPAAFKQLMQVLGTIIYQFGVSELGFVLQRISSPKLVTANVKMSVEMIPVPKGHRILLSTASEEMINEALGQTLTSKEPDASQTLQVSEQTGTPGSADDTSKSDHTGS